MATASEWFAGARPRTLPAALVPVAVGASCGWFSVPIISDVSFALRALLALIVAVALQVGVNYANDYSDGIKGTDDVRVGPVRLVGQELAAPTLVRNAALVSFLVAAVAGFVLVLLTQAWWLLGVGVLAIVAAWFYTGGPKPYGYAGLGEVFVFVFFGVVAVVGTTFVLTARFLVVSFVLSIAVGLLAVALLVVNNLRDIPTDSATGKNTLAVRLGDAKTRALYGWCVAAPFLICAFVGLCGIGFVPAFPGGAIFALIAAPTALIPWRRVRRGAVGADLIPVLVITGGIQLAFGILLSVGIVASRYVG